MDRSHRRGAQSAHLPDVASCSTGPRLPSPGASALDSNYPGPKAQYAKEADGPCMTVYLVPTGGALQHRAQDGGEGCGDSQQEKFEPIARYQHLIQPL